MRFGESAELSLGGGRIYHGASARLLFVMRSAAPALGQPARGGRHCYQPPTVPCSGSTSSATATVTGTSVPARATVASRTRAEGLPTPPASPTERSPSRPSRACEVQFVRLGAAQRASHGSRTAAGATTTTRRAQRACCGPRRPARPCIPWVQEHGWLATASTATRSLSTLDVEHGALPVNMILARTKPLLPTAVSKEMFSGWGSVRQLHVDGVQPDSYHNGSVWPHANAICVAGLTRYGFNEEAHRGWKASSTGTLFGTIFRGPGPLCDEFVSGELPDVGARKRGRRAAAAVPPLDAALRS